MKIFFILLAKGIVLAIWVAIVERWNAYRLERQRKGLPLILDAKSGKYRVKDWTLHVNTGFRYLRNTIYIVLTLAALSMFWLA
ncbi:MAG: hypothetical protein HRU21_10620 [Pseudomonadales bacterium]|nr:hypothetical protein [Pseudomonadales bacterium]